jgi:hypothetical protein
VHKLFLSRDLTRNDVRELVRRGLAATNGNYRALLKLFGMDDGDYKRFLNFLATHECTVDYRVFRRGLSPDSPIPSPLAEPPGPWPARAGAGRP